MSFVVLFFLFIGCGFLFMLPKHLWRRHLGLIKEMTPNEELMALCLMVVCMALFFTFMAWITTPAHLVPHY